MAQYKVESPLLDGFAVGDTVTESDFAEGINVDALVDGGFLSPVKTKTAPAPAEPVKE